jgi:hypothetical protein
MSEIYLITAEQTLVSLKQKPYESEIDLQNLLEKYPSLLAGDQINPANPRQWLLVKREAEVPDKEDGAGRWYLDHLFLDQEGVLTLVEVKRRTDLRIRREVVGQMLDYAANGVKFWPIGDLRAYFEQTCKEAGASSDERLKTLIGDTADQEQFWVTVKTNLQAGRIRMMFVADEIPEELRRVVEFLNEQMDPAEVLAVEIKQFAGQSVKTLVPRLIGQTAEAEERKSVSGGRPKRQWTEASYIEEMERVHGPEAARITCRLLEWAVKQKVDRIDWGQGIQNGSFWPVVDKGGRAHAPFVAYLYGAKSKPCIEITFYSSLKKPPFDDHALRVEWLRRLNLISGVSLSEDVFEKKPNFPLHNLANDDAMAKFLSAMDWYFEQVRNSPSADT